jgi:hypothetical protein
MLTQTAALEELADYKQWVVWKEVDGKKRPFSCKGVPVGATLKYEDRWCYYDDAIKELEEGKHLPRELSGAWDGVGFVFTEDDPFVGIDIDKCRNPETGEITDYAKTIIKEMDSYTEESPSGTGVHIILRGNHLRVGHNPRGKDPVEMYSWGRYFTFNGKHIAPSPTSIEGRHKELTALEERLYQKSTAVEASEWQGVDFKLSLVAKAPSDKLKELLTNLAFKKTWNHTRKDINEKSMSEMDAACARFMVDAGWEPHEVAAGIIEHRRRHCKKDADFNKAMRVDYIGRTWAYAVKCSEEGVDEDEFYIKQAINEAGGDAALHELSNRLGVMVTRVIKMGDVPSDYFVRIDGIEIKLGGADAVHSQSRVSQAIWDVTGKSISRMKSSKWDQVLGLIGAAAEKVEAPGSGRLGELEEVMEQYLDDRKTDTIDIEHAFLGNYPFKDKDYVYVHKGDFKNFMKVHTSLRLRPSDVAKLLIESGWTAVSKTMNIEGMNHCRKLVRKKC